MFHLIGRFNSGRRCSRRHNQNPGAAHGGIAADDKDIMRIGRKKCNEKTVARNINHRVGQTAINGVSLMPLDEMVAWLRCSRY